MKRKLQGISFIVCAVALLLSSLATATSASAQSSQPPGQYKAFLPFIDTDALDADSVAAGNLMASAMAARQGESFNILIRALVVTNLAKDLVKLPAFTLFAPTDAAFRKLPGETLNTLFKRANRDQLRSILRYHLLDTKVLAADAIKLSGQSVKTVNGAEIKIRAEGNDLFINDSKVIAADIQLLGGVVHVIDTVLIPPPPAPPAPTKDIVDTAIAAGNFKTLVAAVQAAGLVDALKQPGPLTVFAPTDDAFAKLPTQLLDALLKPENKAKLTDILTYHVLVGKVLKADAIKLDGQKVKTLNGAEITISVRNGDLFINDSKVIAADVLASNGVIHAIDTVLIPPGFVPPSTTPPPTKDIVDTAIAAGNFKTLVAAVQAAELVDALKQPGPLTVFAPTDDAFAKLPKDLLVALLKPENKDKLTEILTYHVLVGKVLKADALKLDGQSVKTLNGAEVKISVRGGDLFINDSKVIAADVLATNGVIHAIDAVLIPPDFVPPSTERDIVDTAVAAGNFKTLVAALQAAGLVDTLKGDGPFTVFAPTDEAFAKLPAGFVEYLLKPENKDELVSLLTYHVLAGRVTKAQALHLDSARTLNGDDVKLSSNHGDLFVNGALVVAADVEASNGLIHAIDTVLVPNFNIVEVLDASGNFKTLLAALKLTGLDGALKSDSVHYTLFAPTDEAFAKLPDGALEDLLKPQNRAQLVNILTYHVATRRATARELDAAGQVHTLQGSDVTADIVDGTLTLNDDVKVVNPDVNASNGIVHGIDAVLIPPAH